MEFLNGIFWEIYQFFKEKKLVKFQMEFLNGK